MQATPYIWKWSKYRVLTHAYDIAMFQSCLRHLFIKNFKNRTISIGSTSLFSLYFVCFEWYCTFLLLSSMFLFAKSLLVLGTITAVKALLYIAKSRNHQNVFARFKLRTVGVYSCLKEYSSTFILSINLVISFWHSIQLTFYVRRTVQKWRLNNLAKISWISI